LTVIMTGVAAAGSRHGGGRHRGVAAPGWAAGGGTRPPAPWRSGGAGLPSEKP